MNFLILLAAAIIEFNLVSLEQFRSGRWAHQWAAWLQGRLGGQAWWHGWVGAVLVLGVPLALAAAVFHLLFGLWSVLGHLASLAFLLLMLGPYDLNREVQGLRQRLFGGAADAPADGVEEAQPADPEFIAAAREVHLGPPSGDPHYDEQRIELAALAVAAERAWYEPLFWFALGGPLGALAYRLCATLGAAPDSERSVAAALRSARELMEWLPGRITVLALGIAGTLVPVLETAGLTGLLRWGATEELVARSALAAIDNGRIDQVIGSAPRLHRLNLMHALVRRALNVWLVLLALATLAFD